MLRLYVFITLSLFIHLSSSACDVCGCRLGGLSYGILPQHYQHMVGLKYSYAHFRAEMEHNSEYFSDEYSDDTYQRMDLIGRITLLPKLQLNVQLPYLINEMDGTHQKVSSNGIGDPVLMMYYTPFNTGESANTWRHSFLLGGGVKLPLGDFDKEDGGVIINRNFQLGSGSLDYLLTANYTLSVDDWGLNVESSYKMNVANSQGYRFGNQFNVSGYAFCYLESATFGFLPFAGAYFETSGQHRDAKAIQVNTGGNALFATLGTQIYYRQLNLMLDYQHPISQNYHSDDVATITAANRFSIGLIYSIGKTD
ncbi:hypothetical protein [Marinoscillum sp.]|uniref:hypothetical protein n=1 Tax=Marinoscillum sp. TaxID=2024838 RepID=UPI003BAC18B1